MGTKWAQNGRKMGTKWAQTENGLMRTCECVWESLAMVFLVGEGEPKKLLLLQGDKNFLDRSL